MSSALDGQSGLDDVGQECPAGTKNDATVTLPPVAAGGGGGAAEGRGDLRVKGGCHGSACGLPRRQHALNCLRPALSTAPAYACHCDSALGTTMGRGSDTRSAAIERPAYMHGSKVDHRIVQLDQLRQPARGNP